MKSIVLAGVVAAMGVALLTGCEWGGSGDNSFNTSQGAGMELNFSGVYKGTMSGGRLVASKAGAPVTTLIVHHSGNALEVTDNNGSTYRGTVGSPGAVASGNNGTFPQGANLAQAQINFTGNDNTAGGREINFVGVVHAVAVTDIRGTTTASSDSSSTTSSDGGTRVTTTTTFDSTNRIDTTVEVTPLPNGGSQVVTTEVRFDRESGVELSRTQSITTENSSTRDNASYTTYEITEANTQYRLQGSWIEVGAGSGSVDGLSAGTAGLIQTTTTAATP